MTVRILAGAMALALGAASAHAAPAKQEPPSPQELKELQAKELSGQVVSSEKGEFMVKDPCGGSQYSVLVDPTTTFLQNGKVVPRKEVDKEIKEGATVRAAAIPAGDQFFALSVEVEQPAPPQP
jgi:hypothetical protein